MWPYVASPAGAGAEGAGVWGCLGLLPAGGWTPTRDVQGTLDLHDVSPPAPTVYTHAIQHRLGNEATLQKFASKITKMLWRENGDLIASLRPR